MLLQEFLEQTLLNPEIAPSASLSEYQLLKLIEEKIPQFFDSLPNRSALYQKHFWLFHHLYRLKTEFSKKGFILSISALAVSLRPASEAKTQLDERDPLVDFYLDMNNLYLSEAEIADMQKQFWQRFLALENKSQAIKTLELAGVRPLTFKAVKQQYQKLAQRHHPDKGGDSTTFRAIQQAYEELKLLFK
jgi:cell fate (sporulation/competence/biofilm development) regulator YlbF (YheA/YmcA/DUF963 family)